MLPDHLHCEQILSALAAKRHVLSEKPVVVNSDEIRAVRGACARRGGPGCTSRCGSCLLPADQGAGAGRSRGRRLPGRGQLPPRLPAHPGLDWRMGQPPQSVLLGGAFTRWTTPCGLENP